MFAFADPIELWLEVPPTLQRQSWQSTARYGDRANRWNHYLNQVCLAALLDWIRQEHAPNARAWVEDGQTAWEWLPGSVIEVGNHRLAVIPTEAVDDGELAVPQEWIDIPSWIADYYLVVQAGLAEPDQDAPWLRVWGYATHQQIKAAAYDATDRSYCLEAAQLTRDWSTLWVTLQFCPEAQTRGTVAALPELTATQAANLIQRLSNPALAFPRLEVPFQTWAALIENPVWRQQLFQARQGSAGRVNLSQWLQQQITGGWQTLESLLAGNAELAVNLRSTAASAEVVQAKLVTLADQTVALMVQITPEADGRLAILVQVQPVGRATVPAGLELSLRGESGEVLQAVQAGEADSLIQLRRFRCPIETVFQVQIRWADAEATEQFQA